MDETKSRGKKMLDNILEGGAREVECASIDVVRVVIQKTKEWLINRIQKTRSNINNPEEELEKLERSISVHSESIDVGMKKKEIAVMWAMHQLGYSEEETQRVLELADNAYCQKRTN